MKQLNKQTIVLNESDLLSFLKNAYFGSIEDSILKQHGQLI